MTMDKMTDQELIEFVEELFGDVEVCEALNCQHLCVDSDCVLVQLTNRFRARLEGSATP